MSTHTLLLQLGECTKYAWVTFMQFQKMCPYSIRFIHLMVYIVQQGMQLYLWQHYNWSFKPMCKIKIKYVRIVRKEPIVADTQSQC